MEGTLWYEFFCGLRGFHVYSNIWKPKLNEKINITNERGNMYDPNAMAEKIMLLVESLTRFLAGLNSNYYLIVMDLINSKYLVTIRKY